MAKELPYFKFEPDAWENGNIQMCSKSQKGLFIDLCSIYWARLGELPYALALQKHCNGDAIGLQELIDCNIIGLIDGQIIIEFLDEQLDEFQKTSEKRRSAANKRWSDASALQVQSKSNAIREEKIREEKSKEEKIEEIPPYEDFKAYALEKKPNASEEAIKLKYEAWKLSGWKCGKPLRKIVNWKTTLLNTLPYMKEEVKLNGFDTNR